jgi:hypothetical protein
MVNYTRELKFAEDPDYDYLRTLIKKMYKKNGINNDGVYDWLGHSNSIKGSVVPANDTKTGVSKFSKLSKLLGTTKKEPTVSKKETLVKEKNEDKKEKKSEKSCIVF